MHNLFTSELNKLAHKIRRSTSLSWGQALRIAIKTTKANNSVAECEALKPKSLFDGWTLNSQYGLAGHFWALKCLYKEAGDVGRSKAFERVSSQLYAATEAGVALDFKYAVTTKGWGDSVINELIDYFICASTSTAQYTDHTDRVMSLLTTTNTQPARVRAPKWWF